MFIKPSPTATRCFQGKYTSPYSLREEEEGNTFYPQAKYKNNERRVVLQLFLMQ